MQNDVNKIIQKRKNTAILNRTRFAFIRKIGVIAIIVLLLFSFVFGVTTVHGVDMTPAIKDGDIILYFRINSGYNNGDVVIFENKGKDYVSRIAATGGDILKKGTNEQLIFNGRMHPIHKDEGLFYTTMARDNIKYPVTIMKNEYFVLGDKRNTAEDSRTFGKITKSQIKGKVFTFIRKRGI